MTVQLSVYVCCEYILIPVLKSFLFKMKNRHIKPCSVVKAYLKHLVVCFCCDCETKWWRAGIGDREGNEEGKKIWQKLVLFWYLRCFRWFCNAAFKKKKNDIVLRLRGSCPKVAWSSKTIPLKKSGNLCITCLFFSFFFYFWLPWTFVAMRVRSLVVTSGGSSLGSNLWVRWLQ